MNWKLSIIVCINLVSLLLPYNIIGCAGGEPDPYDYFVSFFHNKVSGTEGYSPFYYTNYRFLYEEEEPVNTAEQTSAEWPLYAAMSFSKEDAYRFVCRYAQKDISNLYYHLEKNTALKIPDSVNNNGMTRFFLQKKDLEALGYILYAKQVEPYVTGSWNDWEGIARDSLKMARLVKNGLQLHAAAKSEFIKLRYAYQLARLSHYSDRYADCIKFYDELVYPNKTKSVLHELALALKAGAQFRTGKNAEAAYTFSQLFAASKIKRISNYMSFDWAVKRFDENSRRQSLEQCKNNSEKANMLGLFVLGSNRHELPAIEQVYRFSPQAEILPILVTREVNKLEEFLFTPSLQFQQGKKEVYIGYTQVNENSREYREWQENCRQLINFCKKVTQPEKWKSFYALAAAHAATLSGDTINAGELLKQARKGKLSELQLDQWQLTNILLSINSKKVIDDEFEANLLPSVQWLEKKAGSDLQFAKFYRRLFADVMSAKYKSAGDKNSIKYILCKGVADSIHRAYVKDSWGYYNNALYLLRAELSAQQATALVELIESKRLNAFEKLLVNQSAFNKNDVNDLVGTSWLRQYNFAEAEKWFKKVPAAYYRSEPFTTYLAANPFADLLYDTHRPTKQDTVVYTRLSFCQRMQQLEKELASTTNPERKAVLHYELAKGFYHMSYWGNSWLLVQYEWSGTEASYEYPQRRKSEGFNPDYYEVKMARKHYLEALANTRDKNFQARCIFMAAKCEQKTAGEIPFYFEGDARQKKSLDAWVDAFDKRNSFFTRLGKDFSNTSFYKEAFNSCSYLRDFVKRKQLND